MPDNIMKLIGENSPILKQVCDSVNFENTNFDTEKFAFDLKITMLSSKGIGLASPQVGFLRRVFVIGDNDNILTCFNPEIIETSKETYLDSEGCLSFPGLFLNIDRPKWIVAKYFDYRGNVWERKFDDIWARCFLHENEHLNGIRFIDKVSKLKLDMAKKRRSKNLNGR